MKKLAIIAVLCVNAFAGTAKVTSIKSVMTLSGGLIIQTTENVTTCGFQDRVRVNASDPEFLKRATAIALQAKATNEKVTLWLADGNCSSFLYQQQWIEAITLGEYTQW
jgi:hypothetical protein